MQPAPSKHLCTRHDGPLSTALLRRACAARQAATVKPKPVHTAAQGLVSMHLPWLWLRLAANDYSSTPADCCIRQLCRAQQHGSPRETLRSTRRISASHHARPWCRLGVGCHSEAMFYCKGPPHCAPALLWWALHERESTLLVKQLCQHS